MCCSCIASEWHHYLIRQTNILRFNSVSQEVFHIIWEIYQQHIIHQLRRLYFSVHAIWLKRVGDMKAVKVEAMQRRICSTVCIHLVNTFQRVILYRKLGILKVYLNILQHSQLTSTTDSVMKVFILFLLGCLYCDKLYTNT